MCNLSQKTEFTKINSSFKHAVICRSKFKAVCFVFFGKNSNKRKQPISGRVDRASATKSVDSDSIPSPIKPKTMKIGIHCFPA